MAVMHFRTLVVLLFAAPAWAQAPLGSMQSPDATVRGAVSLSGNTASIMSGSQVETNANDAVIQLHRGGSLRVCRATNVTTSSSANNQQMLLALNAGAIETHYTLASASDAVATPDFRVLLSGPGEFHFAFSAPQPGGLCVQSLPGNASAVVVQEVFGDGSYQVKPGQQVVFRNGSVEGATAATSNCGCGEPAAKAAPQEIGFPEEESKRAAAALAAGTPLPPAAGSAASESGKVYMQVSAPIVFRGQDLPAPVEAPFSQSIALKLANAIIQPLPPEKPAKKKWYQKFGAAFRNIFR